MSDTKVIDFEQARKVLKRSAIAQDDTAFLRTGTQSGPPFIMRRTEHTYQGASTPRNRIGIDSLYPYIEENPQDVNRVIALLAKAVEILDSARSAGNPITADRMIQRFQSMLPEMFRYRSVGDGYAVIVNSIHFAFINLRGTSLTSEQVTTLWRVLKELRIRPFLPFEAALTYAHELEKACFEIDPPILSQLLEGLADE